MIKRFIIIVALLTTVFSAAQVGTSSPYSYYGIGLTNFKGTVENRSMGGLRVFSDSIHINLRNPASYGKLRLTTYTVGGSTQVTSLENETNSEQSRNTSLDYLAIGIPTGKLNFGLGLIPYSSVGYRIQDVSETTANRFTGRGGMNKVYLTSAYSFSRNLSLGVDLNYNFGNIQNTQTTLQEGIQYGTREINRTDISGFNLNFGLDYQQKISGGLKLHGAATYAPEMSISADQIRNIATVIFNTQGREAVTSQRNVDYPTREFNLPSELTLGAGLGRPNKWFLGAEYTNIGAENFNFSQDNMNNVDYRYENAAQYRLGGYYVPQFNSLTSYLSRVVYRAGIRYEESGLYLNNESINEFGITFGLGLPAGTDFSNANIGIEYGQRGTTNSGLVKENYFKLSLSLSLNDRWFVQSRFD